MEVQQKNLCFMAFVLFCMISKHLLHVAGRENKSSCQCWSKGSSFACGAQFSWWDKGFAIHQQGLGTGVCAAGPISGGGSGSMQEPSVRTSSREQPPQRLELWHSGSVTQDSLASVELWQQLWEGCVGLSICFQEPLKLWLPQLTLQVLLWKNRCFSLH